MKREFYKDLENKYKEVSLLYEIMCLPESHLDFSIIKGGNESWRMIF